MGALTGRRTQGLTKHLTFYKSIICETHYVGCTAVTIQTFCNSKPMSRFVFGPPNTVFSILMLQGCKVAAPSVTFCKGMMSSATHEHLSQSARRQTSPFTPLPYPSSLWTGLNRFEQWVETCENVQRNNLMRHCSAINSQNYHLAAHSQKMSAALCVCISEDDTQRFLSPKKNKVMIPWHVIHSASLPLGTHNLCICIPYK